MIAATPLVENRDAKTAAAIASCTPKLQIGLFSPFTHRPVGMPHRPSQLLPFPPVASTTAQLLENASFGSMHPAYTHIQSPCVMAAIAKSSKFLQGREGKRIRIRMCVDR
jgi:hypothetical protein